MDQPGLGDTASVSWEAQCQGSDTGALRLPPWAAGSRGVDPRSAAQHRAHSPGSGHKDMPWARRRRPAELERRWQRWAARAASAEEGAAPCALQPAGSDPGQAAPPARARQEPAVQHAAGAGGFSGRRAAEPRSLRPRAPGPAPREEKSPRAACLLSRCPTWARSLGWLGTRNRGARAWPPPPPPPPRRLALPASSRRGRPAAT